MIVSINFLYGMCLGLLIMDAEDKENYEVDWGFILMLGPVALQVVAPKQ